jgi:hypothetical protein
LQKTVVILAVGPSEVGHRPVDGGRDTVPGIAEKDEMAISVGSLEFIAALSGVVVAWPFSARAQQRAVLMIRFLVAGRVVERLNQ